MFADTLTVTINAVPKVLNRLDDGNYSSEYRLREATGHYVLKIRNTTFQDKTRNGVKVERHNVELIETIFAVAPATIDTKRKAFLTFEHDAIDVGTGPALLTKGLTGFFTDPNLARLVNYEA